MPQQPQHFEAEIKRTVRLDYLLHLPASYGDDPGKRWPLILFLHGSGERGSDLNRVKFTGLPQMLDAQPDFPFIVVSPQCRADSYWTLEIEPLNALLDRVIAGYTVDESRVYLTGLSMGGTGAWLLAAAYPDRFAAFAPICGRGVPAMAFRFTHLPTWVFHGTADDVVPFAESERMVKVVREAGGDVKLTAYPGVGHDSWTQTYHNPELYEWFMGHRRTV